MVRMREIAVVTSGSNYVALTSVPDSIGLFDERVAERELTAVGKQRPNNPSRFVRLRDRCQQQHGVFMC